VSITKERRALFGLQPWSYQGYVEPADGRYCAFVEVRPPTSCKDVYLAQDEGAAKWTCNAPASGPIRQFPTNLRSAPLRFCGTPHRMSASTRWAILQVPSIHSPPATHGWRRPEDCFRVSLVVLGSLRTCLDLLDRRSENRWDEG
jgi:hypothetical protein